MVSRKMSRRFALRSPAEDAHRVVDVARIDRIALLEQTVELRQHAAGELALAPRRPGSGSSPAERDAHAERALDGSQVLVVVAEQT